MYAKALVSAKEETSMYCSMHSETGCSGNVRQQYDEHDEYGETVFYPLSPVHIALYFNIERG
jgi:hypothetical protein